MILEKTETPEVEVETPEVEVETPEVEVVSKKSARISFPKTGSPREDSISDSILLAKKPFTIGELAKIADARFIKDGGTANLERSRYAISFILPVLVRVGYLEKKGSGKTAVYKRIK